MQRGEIWWAVLPRPKRSEPGYRRPLLIIQSDDFNRSRINTVIAAVITSNMHLAQAQGTVVLSKKSSGLPRKSVVNVSQLITLDKAFLKEKAGGLPLEIIQDVDTGIRLVLSL